MDDSIKNLEENGYSAVYSLHDYQTGELIRAATPEEMSASVEAAEHDGGAGVIEVDGRSCYVA